MRNRRIARRLTSATLALLIGGGITSPAAAQPELVEAFVFGTQNDVNCESPNAPGVFYTAVQQDGNPLSIAYPDPTVQLAAGQSYPDPDRTWGYVILYQDPGLAIVDDPFLPPAMHAVGNFAIFGPLDDSPNNRNKFPNACPEEIYDSFIGAKNFLANCDETVVGNPDDPCATAIDPDGVIFRVDLPNGFYRFVAAVGDADNPHAHRVVVENGGDGPPIELGPEHVVLVHNFDQSQHTTGQVDARLGEGVYARVGFDGKLPPAGNGVAPDPQFVDMDENGRLLPCAEGSFPANSPVLEVTEGYIRIHQLQGNSNNGPGANGGRDPNGGDMVLLEIWQVDGPDITPSPSYVTVSHSFPSHDPDCYTPGDTVEVALTVSGVISPTEIVSTFPADWTVTDAGGGVVAGNTVTFNVTADGTVGYSARSASVCTGGGFTVTATPTAANSCPTEFSDGICCDPGLCGMQASGAPNAALIIGPIDLLDPVTLQNVGPQCDDNGNIGTCDYLSDGKTDETNVLVEEGDELEPEFQGAACGFGVNTNGTNLLINPAGFDGVLTVWTANADANGLINYNLDANIGDPGGNTVNDYIVFSLYYLENTTGECLPAVLEVGSDDAVKVRLNGRLVHVNSVCRGVPGYGAGDRVPVILAPGTNVVLVGAIERGGGTGVRLVVRNPDDTPLADGRVLSTCIPPLSYPAVSDVAVTRTVAPPVIATPGSGEVTVTLTATGVSGSTVIEDTFPPEMEVTGGGGQVNGNTVSFTVDADGDSVYTLRLTGDPDVCPFQSGGFSGTATPAGGCGTAVGGDANIGCITTCPATPESDAAELVEAFIFGSRLLDCEVFTEPGVPYTVVHQTGDPLSIAYPDPDIQLAPGAFYPDPDRNWGYVVQYRDPGLLFVDDPTLPDTPPYAGLGDWVIYGPLDNSTNNRGEFADTCPEQIYDSFIGAKNFLTECSAATEGAPDVPCAGDVEGIVFRVDVPNGLYRFVAAMGDADNRHAHRLIAEDGGSGPPDQLGPNHVVLVENYDQAQQTTSQTPEGGDGVYARVGFGHRIPPPGDGIAPDPAFVNMDADGKETAACPSSPVLEVTQGYIRFHQLQGNSNDGPGGARDPNGGDMVVLEIWSVEGKGPVGTPFRRGDADGNSRLELTDPIFVLSFLFLGGPPPTCMETADGDDSGRIELTDGIYILNYLFLGGPAPPAPGPDVCGTDPKGSADLGCEAYSNCP